MIPKIIHYCWFGHGQMPALAQKCIASWKKYFPDYEIREWNEGNFDVNMIPYAKEAYEAKKYAFVSDYARFWILYQYGGLYFDTDVEVIRSMDYIIDCGPFMGCECNASVSTFPTVNPGLGLGVCPGLSLYKEILDLYAALHFRNIDQTLNLKTVVEYVTELLCQHGLKKSPEIQKIADIWIYPKEYFNPFDIGTNRLDVTRKTVSIHHYAGSWLPYSQKLKKKIIKVLGHKLTSFIVKVKHRIRYRK